MLTKRLISTLGVASILALTGVSVSISSSGIHLISVAQAASCDNTIRKVNFSGKVGNYPVNVRSDRSSSASLLRTLAPNTPLQFDAWGYGSTETDIWLGTPDARWYKLAGENAWVSSAVVVGNAPNSKALPDCDTSTPNFNSPAYRQNNPFWRAGYAPKSVNPPVYNMGNPNAKGNCTWYANGRLRELGYRSSALDKLVGDAAQWGNQARAAGIPTSNTPQVGSIAQWNSNHVAVVEEVYSNGTIRLSESSYSDISGTSYDYLYHNYRTVSASSPSTFIHVPR